MKKAVFLDRDGVINRAFLIDGNPVPPKNLNDLEVLAGVKESIDLLIRSNFEIVVVTNQPDVGRGVITQESVESINDYLSHELGIKHFLVCFHDDPDSCECRKPKPGLLLKASRDLNIDLRKSFMVGDRWRDVSAGQAAGCQCFFIDYGYEEKSPVLPYTRVSSLIDATRLILEHSDDTFS
jgi:D-glycero-D-manno-heptose 1,7-bisphosphate phosphatase